MDTIKGDGNVAVSNWGLGSIELSPNIRLPLCYGRMFKR